MTDSVATSVLPTVILDPDGDLLLTVGSKPEYEPKAYKVAASALGRASPVWKAMLFGGWAESKPGSEQLVVSEQWTISHPEDDPDAMEPLLAIIHGRSFEMVPDQLSSPQELHDILVVANKYDILGSLHPWINGWTVCIRNPAALDWKESETKEMMTHIAWELGHETLFFESMRQTCLEVFDYDLEDMQSELASWSDFTPSGFTGACPYP